MPASLRREKGEGEDGRKGGKEVGGGEGRGER